MSKDIMKKSRILPANFGPLKGADANAKITGPCGDTMEMWFSVENDRVSYATFTTDGCMHSVICGSTAADMLVGMSVDAVSDFEADEVLTIVRNVPEESAHCALLAVNTIKKAAEDMRSRELAESEVCSYDSDPLKKPDLGSVKHKIVVLSGKGGVGKSTFAVNMAAAVAAAGYKTGLLDIDFHGPSIPVMMGVTEESVTSGNAGIIPVQKGNLKIISIGNMIKDQNEAVIWRGPMKMGVIRQFLGDVDWGDLDYLFIDCPPGTGDEPLTICQLIDELDGAVVLTTPQEVAAADVRKSVNFCKQLGLPVLGLVENMSGFTCPSCGEITDIFSRGGGSRTASLFEVPFLGSVPIEPAVGAASDEGIPYVAMYRDTPVSRKFQEIIAPLLKLEEAGEDDESKKIEDKRGGVMLRIAVPVSGGKLNMHFGHCDKFALIDVDGQKIVGKSEVDAPPHEPGLLPVWLSEKEVNKVIAGGMGQRAQTLFNDNNIDVITGAPADEPEALVTAYLNGSLITGDNVCDH